MASIAKRFPKEDKSPWIVRYKEGGKHRQKTFKLFKSADAFRRKVEHEIDAGIHVVSKRTVESVSEEFLRDQETRVKDKRLGRARYEQIKSTVDLNIIPLVGSKVLSELKWTDVVDFYNAMCATGRLSPFTARSRVKDFGMVVEYGRRRGWIKTDIMKDAGIELRGIRHEDVRTFTLEEMGKLLSVVDVPFQVEISASDRQGIHTRSQNRRAHLYTKCFVHLAAFCGLRIGEIMALPIQNVDFERRIIRVRQSITEWDEVKAPKTAAGVRDVPMPRPVAATVEAWITRHYVPNDRGLLFRGVDGQYSCRNSFRTGNWIVLLKRAGLYDPKNVLRFHALRHFAASWMIENGLAMPDVARLLGHKKFDLTLRTYAHPVMADAHRHDAMDRMSGRLVGLLAPVSGAPLSGVDCAPVAQGQLTP